jgi:predicted transcriptional regulator YdeE
MATETLSPEIEYRDGFTVVGIPHEATDHSDFEAFWETFDDRRGECEAARGEVATYGVSDGASAAAHGFRYVTGVRAAGDRSAPDGWSTVEVLAGQYAVFSATPSVADSLMSQVYREWLPASAYEREVGPEFERYGPDSGATGAGTPAAPVRQSAFTIHVPIRER